MRKIIASIITSLDGVTDEPGNWSLPYFTDESATHAEALLSSCEALLLGRRTYEGFAAAWPHMEESEGEFAVRMNTMPKYVVSSTLEKAEWTNSTILTGAVDQAVGELKRQPGGDLLVYGSIQLTHALIEHGLLDELRLFVHPVFLGRAEAPQLIREGSKAEFELVDTAQIDSGVVILTYRPSIP